MLHPAWQWFVDTVDKSPDDCNRALKLAWRRAACREPDAQAASEKERGGLLKLLQSENSPRRLAVPPGTLGTVNAYMQQTEVLSAAVCAYIRTTTDPFYATEPLPITNYGGRGGSQQLWWCGSVRGWRGSAPNSPGLLRQKRASKRGSQTNMPAPSPATGKRQVCTSRGKLAHEGLTDEDIAGLPVLLGFDETPATATALTQQGLVDADPDNYSMFALKRSKTSRSMFASTDSESCTSSVWTDSEQESDCEQESDSARSAKEADFCVL
eukprot:COSAG02_NODE_1643_length_11528_cov_19.259865_12_plen_268_part_00